MMGMLLDMAAGERAGKFMVIKEDNASGDLLQRLLPDPDRLMSDGEEVHSGRFGGATDTVSVHVGEQQFLLKRYNCPNLGYRLKNFLRPSKAHRSWRTAKRMLALGIPTPPPLLCLEERRFGFLGRSYLVTPFIGGEGNLWKLWEVLPAEDRSTVLREAASLIGRMHRSGILHGDLNWRNILVRRNAKGREFFLVDLDCSRFQRAGRLPVERDLAHFVRDLRRHGGDEAQEHLFLQSWQQEAKVPIPAIRTGEESG